MLTDAWDPQVNGVVTTLMELEHHLINRGHKVKVVHPGLFDTRPCPGYPGIELAIQPGRRLPRLLEEFQPQAIHLATEGPIGWAGRRYCQKQGLAFTTAYHTRFPEILKAALGVPLSWTYALYRLFHKPSSAVLVPTEAMIRELERRRFDRLCSWTHGVDLSLFPYAEHKGICRQLGPMSEPIFLYVGRISYEKNVKAFLDLVLPGTKVVCGVGPIENELKTKYPHVRWLGVLPREQLAEIYSAADVVVFPSRHETFGLVMLEAMACGTPVAAYPVDGPTEVVGGSGQEPGGVLDDNLRQACLRALEWPRWKARRRAEIFDWKKAVDGFEDRLVAARANEQEPLV